MGTARSSRTPSTAADRPSALRTRWATTWPRVQPGSRLGSLNWKSAMASTVRTSRRVADSSRGTTESGMDPSCTTLAGDGFRTVGGP